MNTNTIHEIVTIGTACMIAGTVIALFGLYKMGIVRLIKDFFTGKTANNG